MEQISEAEKQYVHQHPIAGLITDVIDFFYPPFKKYIPHQTFRYIACGGSNQVLNLVIYYLSIHYLFHDSNWNLGFMVIKPHIAAFIVAFCISFPIGFLLAKYVIFHGSPVKGKTQAIRYVSIVVICLALNYFILKLFVEVFHWYPTPSMIMNIIIVTMFSYVSQKKFAFKSVG
jgi:putative flippase GtrA